ncbi:MAG: hypothetical protein HXS44_14885 [Theionarchaea archaeon]|nr:hypothetical protein [Theionarchaea archaeon]
MEDEDHYRKIYIGVFTDESEVQPECRKNEEDLKVQVGPKKEVKGKTMEGGERQKVMVQGEIPEPWRH